MRSVGCVINDFADRDFDGAVERTKTVRSHRAGSRKRSPAADGIFVSACRIVPDSAESSDMADEPARAVPCADLPVYQTLFPIPQFYLGLAFSFGIPMAFAAVGNSVPVEAWILFAANVLWTLAYDTVYAMADKEDDLKIGIKTSAVTFGRYDIAAVMLCHGSFTLLM